MVRRVKGQYDEESPARAAGLSKSEAIKAGFKCECGTQLYYGAYAIAHWEEVLQHRCAACGRLWRVKAGEWKLTSGPNRRPARIEKLGTDTMLDPNEPFWRVYHRLNNGPRPASHAPASDYHKTLDQANDQAFTYAQRLEPHSRSRADDLYSSFIRKQEWPLLSSITIDGMPVASGHLQSIGNRLDETRGGIMVTEFELRAPNGSVARITLTPEVWEELTQGLEYVPEKEQKGKKK